MVEENVPGFPGELGKDFESLWQEVVLLHANWRLYMDLFAAPDDLRVINDTTPGAFGLIEVALRQAMVMAFGRLLDPSNSGKDRDNLSLHRLVEGLEQFSPELHADLEGRLQEIHNIADPAMKAIRDKTVAHMDRATAHGTRPEPIPAVSRPLVEKSLEMTRVLMNYIQLHFTHGVSDYTNPIQVGTGKDLLENLRLALKYREQEYTRRGQKSAGRSNRPHPA
jgi:hypothetical protein